MQRIAIGEVLGAHADKGEVRVQPLTDFPDRFHQLEWVYLGEDDDRRIIQSVRKHGRFFLVKLEGVKTQEEASRLRGRYLFLPRNLLVDLPEGHFFLWEIVGLEVLTTCGRRLGVVEEVLSRPANDVYVVRDSNGRELLVPALRQVVVQVDLKLGQMVVTSGPAMSWEG